MPTPGVSAWFVALVAVIFFWGGAALQGFFSEPGLLAAEWLLLFIPTVAFIVVGGFDPLQTLSLRRPTLRQAGTSVVVIAGALPLVARSLLAKLAESLKRCCRASSDGVALKKAYGAALRLGADLAAGDEPRLCGLLHRVAVRGREG